MFTNDMNEEPEKDVVNNLNRNLSLIYSKCENIAKKYRDTGKISEKDYVLFTLSADIYYRTRDLIFLNNILIQERNNFDSSLYLLSRSVVETFIYLNYLLCDEDKIMYKLRAFTCHSINSNELKITKALVKLADRKKFIFSDDPKNILSAEMLGKKIIEFISDVEEFENFYKNDPSFKQEVTLLKNVESVAQEYDKIKNINSVEQGFENISMEWMYNYVYRFQCMSAHQSLREKEKVFKLFESNNDEPSNEHIIGLLDDIAENVLSLYTQDGL
jgi:hypothetical protein